MSLQVDGEGAVAEQVAAFAASLSAEGAWFHPSLAVRCADGALSMVSQERFTTRRSLLRIPVALMPMVASFDWSIVAEPTGPHLSATPRDNISDAHRDIMTAMVDLYNASGKLGHWQGASPWAALRDHPDVLALLFHARHHMAKAQAFRQLSQEGDHDTLLIKTFLGSRTVNLSPRFRRKAGHGEVETGAEVLLPVIDYFNHRLSAEGYSIHETPSPVSMRVFGTPDPDSDEMFVRYNAYDPLDTYLFYGFVDTGAPWLGSIPLSLTVGDKILAVEARGGTVKGALPPRLRDLRMFLPQITGQDNSGLTLNKLMIPNSRAPRALQRVLAHFASMVGVSQAQLQSEVARLEEEILLQNEQYWKELAQAAVTLAETHPVHVLCRYAIDHLDAYRQCRPGLTDA